MNMKRFLILTLSILALPMLAGAQSKAIKDLAAKYSDRDGFTTVSLTGEMAKMLSGSNKGMDMLGQMDISNVMSDISSIIMITAENPTAEFREDVRKAVAEGNYSTIMSVSDGGQSIKFLLSKDQTTGKGGSKENEFVMVILGGGDSGLLISIVGVYKVK